MGILWGLDGSRHGGRAGMVCTGEGCWGLEWKFMIQGYGLRE